MFLRAKMNRIIYKRRDEDCNIVFSKLERYIKEGIHSFIMKEGNCNNAFSELREGSKKVFIRFLTEKETVMNREGKCNFL